MFLPFLVPVVNNTGGELDICLLKKGLVAFFPLHSLGRGKEKHRQNFGVVLFLLIGQCSGPISKLKLGNFVLSRQLLDWCTI